MVFVYRLITLLGVCSSASANIHLPTTELAILVIPVSASWIHRRIVLYHVDVNGKGSFVGEQGISADDYKSGKGCVNQGPDGLGSVIVSPNLPGTLARWAVETNYCVLAYKRIDCVGSMDIKQDWKLGKKGKCSNEKAANVRSDLFRQVHLQPRGDVVSQGGQSEWAILLCRIFGAYHLGSLWCYLRCSKQ